MKVIKKLEHMIKKINDYNNSMREYSYITKDELNEYFEGLTVKEILKVAHFGDWDYEDYYFKLDAEGNLYSIEEHDYQKIIWDDSAYITECYYTLLEDGLIK